MKKQLGKQESKPGLHLGRGSYGVCDACVCVVCDVCCV